MERTSYFNHTRPGQTQLDNTETTKTNAVLRRFRSVCQMGIRTGFRVIVNGGDQTLIDIGPGEGYTGGFYRQENVRGNAAGERISTLTDAVTGQAGYVPTATGQALADYTNNVKNYVHLVYSETSDTPLSERYYPFTPHDTIFRETFTVSVLTETQWNALTYDQLSNRVLVGIVTARGAGIALQASDIQQMVQPKTHPTAANPTSITGITVSSISQDTLIGTATLRYEASTKKLYWTAPSDSEGTGVQITNNGTYTLYSDNTSYWISLEVIYAALPSGNVSESINITSLYGRTVPMACSIDQAHRDMVGSGQPTVTNPHGTTLDDISGGTLTHADLFHVNGISVDANDAQLQCAIDAVNDTIEITNTGGQRNSFLVDGVTYQTLTGVPAGTDGVVSFDVIPAPNSGDYMIYVDSAGNAQRVQISSYVPADAADLDVLFSANIRIVDIKNEIAGNGVITWDAATSTLTWQAPGDGAAGAAVTVMRDDAVTTDIQGYYKLYSSNTDNWIIVHCFGALGASNNSTIYVAKNETDHADESILKLAVVTWNALGELLGNLRDLRRFVTADNREQTEEEHDENGYHTKVFRNQLRVTTTGYAIMGRANEYAVAGLAVAGNVGLFGSAQNIGVYGLALTNTGVFGSAPTSYGVYGQAATIGVYGRGTAATGVYGSAPTIGVKGTCQNDIAGCFTAGVNTAVLGIADNFAGWFSLRAGGATCVYAHASATAVYGRATANIGVYGTAGAIMGVVGQAPNTAGYFTADANYGIRVEAGNDTAGYFSAANNLAGYFTHGGGAASAVGVTSPNLGIGIAATNRAINGIGGTAAIAGTATNGMGILGEGQGANGIGGVFSGASLGVRITNTCSFQVGAAGGHASAEEMPVMFNGVLRYIPMYA